MAVIHPRGERGAAIFVVVLVITMLTTVGLFAAHSAALVDTATGNARQAAQSQALAVYATQLAATELGRGRAELISQRMALRSERCLGNIQNSTVALPCYKLLQTDLQGFVQTETASALNVLEAQQAATAGSLGPPHGEAGKTTGVEGNLLVEFLDGFQAPPPAGENMGGTSPYVTLRFTVASSAQVRPILNDTPSSDWCVSGPVSTTTTLQTVRAYVNVPGVSRQ